MSKRPGVRPLDTTLPDEFTQYVFDDVEEEPASKRPRMAATSSSSAPVAYDQHRILVDGGNNEVGGLLNDAIDQLIRSTDPMSYEVPKAVANIRRSQMDARLAFTAGTAITNLSNGREKLPEKLGLEAEGVAFLTTKLLAVLEWFNKEYPANERVNKVYTPQLYDLIAGMAIASWTEAKVVSKFTETVKADHEFQLDEQLLRLMVSGNVRRRIERAVHVDHCRLLTGLHTVDEYILNHVYNKSSFVFNPVTKDIILIEYNEEKNVVERGILKDSQAPEFCVVDFKLEDPVVRIMANEYVARLIRNQVDTRGVALGVESVSMVSPALIDYVRKNTFHDYDFDIRKPETYEDESGRRIYNLFKGWSYGPCNHMFNDQIPDRYKAHIRWCVGNFFAMIFGICHGDPLDIARLLYHASHPMFGEDAKSGKCVILTGNNRTGKSTVNLTFKAIYHPYTASVNRMDQLIGRFSNQDRAVYIAAEECNYEFMHEGALKNIITSPTKIVEEKFKQQKEIKDFSSIVMTTNVTNGASIYGGDDRTHVIECSSFLYNLTPSERQEYFKKIYIYDSDPKWKRLCLETILAVLEKLWPVVKQIASDTNSVSELTLFSKISNEVLIYQWLFSMFTDESNDCQDTIDGYTRTNSSGTLDRCNWEKYKMTEWPMLSGRVFATLGSLHGSFTRWCSRNNKKSNYGYRNFCTALKSLRDGENVQLFNTGDTVRPRVKDGKRETKGHISLPGKRTVLSTLESRWSNMDDVLATKFLHNVLDCYTNGGGRRHRDDLRGIRQGLLQRKAKIEAQQLEITLAILQASNMMSTTTGVEVLGIDLREWGSVMDNFISLLMGKSTKCLKEDMFFTDITSNRYTDLLGLIKRMDEIIGDESDMEDVVHRSDVEIGGPNDWSDLDNIFSTLQDHMDEEAMTRANEAEEKAAMFM